MPSRLSHSRIAAISSGAASCSESEVVEAEHHQRVGVGQDPFVDRELVAGLVDALEDRHRMPGGLAGQLLERQGGAVEQLQGAGDALQEVRRVVLRRLVGRPQRRCAPRSWSRSGCPCSAGSRCASQG